MLVIVIVVMVMVVMVMVVMVMVVMIEKRGSMECMHYEKSA